MSRMTELFNARENEILQFIRKNSGCSSTAVHENISEKVSIASVKRSLSKLLDMRCIETIGKGKATKYFISNSFLLNQPIDMDAYYTKEVDEREIKQNFNFELLDILGQTVDLFSPSELDKIKELQEKYLGNIKELSENQFANELERLAIDLSWKSSQIEGNTYSLLETEQLLKEKKTAVGKTKEEAVMLLNHKDAIDFIIAHPDFANPLSVSSIENLHQLLAKELPIERNLRTKRVGISGTNYRPLDNSFQIKEALQKSCEVINGKESVFEKALLSLVLISYIQPFMDGNKRTARIISNSILIHAQYCPISFRTVDSMDYKKAMLLFYEQNNIAAFKDIFIQQFEFAVETYF